MPLPANYNAGTVTVSANGTSVTGNGTNWVAGAIRSGDIFAARGLTVSIAAVNSATSLTLAEAWPGAALATSAYEIRYVSDATRVLAASRAAIAAIEQLINAGGGGGDGSGGPVTWSNVLNKPTTFPPAPHSHTIAQITNLQSNLNSLQASIDAIIAGGGGGTGGGPVDWAAILNKPTLFPPESHSHSMVDFPDFQAAINTRLAASAVSSFALTLLDDATAVAMRATLGLGSFATLNNLANNYVTNARLADMPTMRIKGNNAAATGDPVDLTVEQVKAMLALTVDDLPGLSQSIADLDVRITAIESSGGGTDPGMTAPVVTNAATISGTGVVGDVLTLAIGGASGVPEPVYAIQWLRGGSNISGATHLTYTPVAGDANQTLTARVTWSNPAGSTVSSATVAISAAPPVEPEGPPLVYEVDWESGNTSGADYGWDMISSSLVTSPTLGGSYAAQVTGSPTGWGFQIGVGDPTTELYTRQKIRLDVTTNPSVDEYFQIMQFGNSTGWQFTVNHDCYPNGTSLMDAWIGAAATYTASSTMNIPRGQTVDLEIYIRVAATGGRFVMRVNGAVAIDFTGNTGTEPIDRINYLAQATDVRGAVFTHTFDDHIGSVEDWPVYGAGGTGDPGDPPPPTGGAITATAIASGVQPARLGLSNSDGDYLFSSYGTPAQIMADVDSTGTKWVRSDMRINRIRSSRGGTPSWGFYDTMVNTFTANGGKLLPILMPGGWLGESMSTAQNRTDFRDHAVECVNRYKDRVKHWQIMNELNHNNKTTPANYAALLNLIYPAMKAADPDCVVVLQGTSSIENTVGSHTGALPFLQGIFANGAGNSFDAVAHHPYTVWETPDGWQNGSWHGWQIMYSLHDYLITQGQGHKQIWITEYGQAVQGDPDGTSPEHQLLTMQQAYDRIVRDNRFGPLFIYTHRDREVGADDSNSETWWGLKSRAGAVRPAYTRYLQLTSRDNNGQVLRPASGSYQYFAGRLFEVEGNPRRSGVTYTMSALSGVSINASTGIVTIASTATAGTVTITATRDGDSAQATLQIVTS